MKIKSVIVLFFVLLFLINSQNFPQDKKPFNINESPLPKPVGFVSDYAEVIDSETEARIESRLVDFRNTTKPSIEIGVAVVKTTGDIPIFDYSLAVARGWGIGSKEEDNPGALLFVAIDDRKYFTQVSRDLEDELPDGVVGSLQRLYLVPEFKKGNYGKGIEDTVNAYIRKISEQPKTVFEVNSTNEPSYLKPEEPSLIYSLYLRLKPLLILLALILIPGIIYGISQYYSSDPWAGDWADDFGGGSSSGGSYSSGSYSSSVSSYSSSSSSWSGGSSSSSGGGFGGFSGGGDFGGGGAGGSW